MSSDDPAPGPGDFARSSSFARSFYQPQSEEGPTDVDAAVTAAAAAAASPVRQSRRMSRRASRRNVRLGGGSGGGGSGASGLSNPGNDAMARAAAAAAAAAALDDDDENQYDGGSGSHKPQAHPQGQDPDSPVPPPPSKERQASWYQDALLQAGAGAEDLSKILGNEAAGAGAAASIPAPPIDDGPNTENDEVLEQYKIMAHLDASQRVHENTGFEPAEYEKRRKVELEGASQQVEYFTGKDKPKPILPDIKVLPRGMAETLMYQPQEPPPLGSIVDPSSLSTVLSPTKQRTHGLVVEQRSFLRLPPRRQQNNNPGHVQPAFVTGTVIRGSAQAIPEGEQAVRCLGCNIPLRVSLLASLLQCPDCHTVCPAGIIRR